ncbi:hypothetical protein BaRGS_00031301 [Batillaria attramentaria]|uniref:Uncharacterized protein n=1 Tax=Batillaria attramentaria TaxID=370345 RepID=A0ABD0JRG3_9CAEN
MPVRRETTLPAAAVVFQGTEPILLQLVHEALPSDVQASPPHRMISNSSPTEQANAGWLKPQLVNRLGSQRCINNDTVGKGRVLRKHLGMTSGSGLEGTLCTARLHYGVTDRLLPLSDLIGQI